MARNLAYYNNVEHVPRCSIHMAVCCANALVVADKLLSTYSDYSVGASGDVTSSPKSPASPDTSIRLRRPCYAPSQ